MKLRAITFILSIAALLGLLSAPVTTYADSYGLDKTARSAGLLNENTPKDVPTITGNIIGTALSMISVIFFILMVYGGFLWMTAHGDEGQVKKAQDTIIGAVIGIIVILASYAITDYVTKSVISSGPGGGGGGPQNQAEGGNGGINFDPINVAEEACNQQAGKIWANGECLDI